MGRRPRPTLRKRNQLQTFFSLFFALQRFDPDAGVDDLAAAARLERKDRIQIQFRNFRDFFHEPRDAQRKIVCGRGVGRGMAGRITYRFPIPFFSPFV